MNPSLSRVPASVFEVRLPGGPRFPGRVWPAESPRALISVIHGLGEHVGRYAALASDLAQAGYTVAGVDLPGHGESPGPRGDVPSWMLLREQLVPATFTAAHGLPGQPENPPVVLLGHSLGGVLALDYALAHPQRLVAAVASGPGLRSAMPPWWKLALANVARVTAPSAGFPHGLDESGISRDPEVMRLRDEDPLVHDRISPRLYFELSEAQQRVLRDARRLQIPVLLLQGAADRVVDPRGAAEFHAAAPPGLSKLVTYPEAYHEIFNEPVRPQALRDLLGWLGELFRH